MKDTSFILSGEAAAILKTSPTTLLRWVRTGIIPALKMGGTTRFNRAMIERVARYGTDSVKAA